MPEWFEIVSVLAAGLVFGSFTTLVSYRLPRDENIVTGHSRCPCCEKPLGALALVPVLSWMVQGGKCRYCKAKISARYPLIELSQALLFLWVYFVYGISLAGLVMALFTVCLLIMIVVDLEWQIIPDEIQVAMGVLAIAYYWVMGGAWGDVLGSGALGLGIGLMLHHGYRWLRHKEGLGFGDVKFLLVAGLWLASFINWAPFLFLAGLCGVLTAMIWRLLGQGERFPFGPALAVSLFLGIMTPVYRLFYWTIGSLFA